jgi:protein ImuB
VIEGDPPMQFVCSLNTKARLLNMTRGMTRVDLDTFPASVILPRSQKTERATSDILLECAAAFSPRIEDRSEGTAFLCGIDIAGSQSLFGPPEMLARMLLQRVRGIGIKACVTVSSNFHAAVCLAKGLSAGVSARCIAQGEEATALASLPLPVLDLTETQTETLSLWGIHTLGMLAALPEKELIARMGQEGKRLRQAALGQLPHHFQPVEPPFVLEERMELDTPVDLLEPLLFVAGVMLEQLIVRARARILALASVTVTLTLDGGSTHMRTVRPALPANEKPLWIKLIHLDLEAHPPQAAILAVALSAEPGSISKVQLGLFSPQLPEASRLDVTLARIRAVVGEDCVGRAVLEDSHGPEAFRLQPFTVPSSEPSAMTILGQRLGVRQLRPPEIVSVTIKDSRPAIFFLRSRRYAVARAYGPWLTGGDWWNRTLWGFEQWDLVAHAEDGATLCCCMMRDIMRNQWQVAALYD